MKFEWNIAKATADLSKHSVSFDEGAMIFIDQLALSGSDPNHSVGEPCYITFGMSSLGRLLAVSHMHCPGGISPSTRMFSGTKKTVRG